MLKTLIIGAGTGGAALGAVGLAAIWLWPQSGVARALAPGVRGLQPSRANRALTASSFVLFGSYLALSAADYQHASYFILGALYPVLGFILFRAWSCR